MVRKARQNPEWVAEHNKRFGRISKTTVLPKDKTVAQLQTLKNWGLAKPKVNPVQAKKLHQRLGTKSEKWINDPKKLDAFIKSEDPNKRVNKYEDDHPYLKGIEEDLEEIDKKGKSWFSKHLKKTQPKPKAMPLLTYVDKMNVAYSGQDKIKYDIVVMVQGDEPLVIPETIVEMLPHFNDSSVEIVNVMSRLRSYDQFMDKNNGKVVVNNQSNALYFSREPIPSPWKGIENLSMYMQTGIIAFRREALLKFNSMNETALEQIESVDMNRLLEHGYKVKMVETTYQTLAVDIPKDLKIVEEKMKNDLIIKDYS